MQNATSSRSFLPKSASIIALGLITIIASYNAAAIDVLTDPVGFITLQSVAAGPNQFSFLGTGMIPVTYDRGIITSTNGGNQIVNSGATWTNNQFNGVGNAWFIELITNATSNAGIGITDDIVATSGTGPTITTANNLSQWINPSNTQYRIRKHWTIETVFGTTNSPGGWVQNTDFTIADNIIVPNPVTQGQATYYFRTGKGWRSTGSAVINAATNVLYFDQGILVKRAGGTATNIVLVGEVKLGQTSIPVLSGVNYLSLVTPITNMTLGVSKLFTGLAATGVSSNTDFSVADNVLLWNGAGYDVYYFRTGKGWRSTGSAVTDKTNVQLPMGGAFIVQRRDPAGMFNWLAPQTFTP